MRLKDNPSACVEPEYRGERTCRECYFSQVNEKNQWTGSQRCWNAGCIEADTNETPTDKLRALLDERGIEYETRDALGACETSWCGCSAYQLTPESKLIMNPTPEQAIAATVGADYGIAFAPTLERPPETMVGETVFDAEGNAIGWIANATVGVGTCENERTATIVKVPHKDYISIGHYECGLCGASITPVMRYCHGCGARLEGAIE